MSSLDLRLKKLETTASKVHLAKLSDAQLDAHIRTLGFGTPECYSAIIARVLRHPSVFPVVRDEPSYLSLKVSKPQSKHTQH